VFGGMYVLVQPVTFLMGWTNFMAYITKQVTIEQLFEKKDTKD